MRISHLLTKQAHGDVRKDDPLEDRLHIGLVVLPADGAVVEHICWEISVPSVGTVGVAGEDAGLVVVERDVVVAGVNGGCLNDFAEVLHILQGHGWTGTSVSPHGHLIKQHWDVPLHETPVDGFAQRIHRADLHQVGRQGEGKLGFPKR